MRTNYNMDIANLALILLQEKQPFPMVNMMLMITAHIDHNIWFEQSAPIHQKKKLQDNLEKILSLMVWKLTH